jgi:anti-anti-sigma factor
MPTVSRRKGRAPRSGELMADVSRTVPFRAAVPARDLVVEPELTEAAAVLQLSGVLTPATAPLVRVAIQEEFAGHALPVVCDLAELRRIDSTAIGVFHAAAADCGGWPIVALALARPRATVASQLRKSGAGKFVVIADTLAAAAQAALNGPRVLRDAIDLDPATAVVDGRRFAADCCLRWLAPELLDPIADCALDLLQRVATATDDRFSLQITYDRKIVVLRARRLDGSALLSGTVEPPGRTLGP